MRQFRCCRPPRPRCRFRNGWNCTSPTATWRKASSRFMPTSGPISTVATWPGAASFLLETLAAVREVWPENLPLTARFGVIEFDGRDEETLAESIALATAMAGLDLLGQHGFPP